MTDLTTPREIDTEIARLWHKLDAAKRSLGYVDSEAQGIAHDARRIRVQYGRKGAEWKLTRAEAYAELERLVAEGDAYILRNSTRPSAVIAKRDERAAVVDAVAAEVREAEALYTGWSRFFVVTSSTGHVHSSTACHTCRVTTEFGWLPELSGKTEADAVAELGSVLCSVCFASAPVEHQGGKLTKAQAAKRAA